MIYTNIKDKNRRLEQKPWCPHCGSWKVTNTIEYNKVISVKCKTCKRFSHLWKIRMNNNLSKPFMYYFQQEDGEMFIEVMTERCSINKFPTNKWIKNHVFDFWLNDPDFRFLMKMEGRDAN